jgi:phosphoribosylformimino-5-aminoimidazole carboxamide ribotide isomerase
VNRIVQRLNCQVGGGIRSLETAQEVLEAGARKVILGSALLEEGKINTHFAATLASTLGTAALVFALDSEVAGLRSTASAKRLLLPRSK